MIFLNLFALPTSNKICHGFKFGPKRYVSVMGSLRKQIVMFPEISHVIPTLENMQNINTMFKNCPE